MAAAESKQDVLDKGLARGNDLHIDTDGKIEHYELETMNILFCVISVSTFIADVVTDGILVAEYFSHDYPTWAYFTLGLILVPAGVIHLLSLRWHRADGSLDICQWILHSLLVGILYRYLALLHATIRSHKSNRSTRNKAWFDRQRNNICILHLFESFMESAPQLLLQLYVVTILRRVPFWTSVSAVTSVCSLAWAITAYAKANHRPCSERSDTNWPSFTLQAFWKGGMLVSRMTALLLAAVCTKEWIFLLLGVHWLCVTAWINLQKTDNCFLWEEQIYNCALGVVYCFDYFNFDKSQSRPRVLTFYLIMAAQNITFLTVYVIYFESTVKSNLSTASTIVIIGGSSIGLASMSLYYSKFYPRQHARFCGSIKLDTEIGVLGTVVKSVTPKLSKHHRSDAAVSITRSAECTRDLAVSEEVTADKKCLLTNIVQSSEFVEEGIVHQSCDMIDDVVETMVRISIEDENPTDKPVNDAANSSNVHAIQYSTNDARCSQKKRPNASTSREDSNASSAEAAMEDASYTECEDNEIAGREKRRGLCAPVEFDLETVDHRPDDPDSSLRSQKRRGICSSVQFDLELVTDEDNYVEKNFTFEKRRPIVGISSEIESKLNGIDVENLSEVADEVVIDDISGGIRGRERLDTPVISASEKMSESDKISEISQKEETMSHVTSVHDYENVCSLGIARPPWCIRSWKGYTDIETYIHDDSVVRDRRRDTLTSSATGTTFSSEFSDPTCATPPLRRALKRTRQDDYMDTLVYDLADWESNLTSNEEASTYASSDVDEQESSVFIAKPVVIDDKGGMLALDTILEEREDSTASSDAGMDTQRTNRCCPASTLVATIDEIRKCTIENSPRHVYHRTESHWEDLDPKILIKKAQLAKVLFTSDLNNLANSSERMSEIEAIKEVAKHGSIATVGRTPLISAILSDSPILGPKSKIQKFDDLVDSLNASSLDEHNIYVEMRPLVTETIDEGPRIFFENSAPSPLRGTERMPAEEGGNSSPASGIAPSSVIRVRPSVDARVPRETSPSIENYRNSQRSINSALSSKCLSVLLECASPISPRENTTRPAALLHASHEKRRRTMNRPRRKFSLLRERFEPKSEMLVYSVTPEPAYSPNRMVIPVAVNEKTSIRPNDKPNVRAAYDKENLTPAITSRISSWNSFIHEHNSTNAEKHEGKSAFFNKEETNLREKRSIFLKQVLSPPKLQSWSKKRTFSPNGKIVPKAV